jgi:glycerophosphoryl diester phosphodiesterase
MPSLDEVLAAFPDKRFLINIKSDDAGEGEILGKYLARLPEVQRRRVMAYGGERPMRALKRRLPSLRVMSKASLKDCGYRYIAAGWTGYVPQACRNTLLILPVNYAGWIWGWPNRFLERMRSAGTDVYVAGPYAKGDAGSSGIDDAAAFAELPPRYDGGIWTNRIDLIGPLVRAEP